MPNPGAFQGSRKRFLLGEKDHFSQGVQNGTSGEALAVIQRRYFKRYPIDLPHNEEPSAEHLAAVDDDAPEPDIKQPDATKMGPAEFVDAMTRLTERKNRIKQRKSQIKRWLIYQYMKDHDSDPRDRRASSPYQAYLAKIRGQAQEKPRWKSACNVWRKFHRTTIESKAKECSAREKVPKGKQAALRDKIARDMFAALPEEERKEWSLTAETDHEEALREWKEAREKGASTTPEDRQRAIQGLVRFVQPVLDVIAASTGWQVSLFAGGPEPALQGMLNIISVHSGTTSGDVKVTFGQAERTALKKDFIPTMGRYLQKCYTPEECRARALAEEEGYVPLSEMEMEGSTGLIHGVPDTSTSTPAIPVAPQSSHTETSAPSPDAPLPATLNVGGTVAAPRTLGTVAITPVATMAGVLNAPPAPQAIPSQAVAPGALTPDAASDVPTCPATPHALVDTPFPSHFQLPFDSPSSRSASPQPSRSGSPAISPPPSPIQTAGTGPLRAESPPPSPMLFPMALGMLSRPATPTSTSPPSALALSPSVASASIMAAVAAVSIDQATPTVSALSTAPAVSVAPVNSILPPAPAVTISSSIAAGAISSESTSPAISASPVAKRPGVDLSKKGERGKVRKIGMDDKQRPSSSDGALDERPRRSIKKTEKAISIEKEAMQKNARGKKRANEESGDTSIGREGPAKRMRGLSKRKGETS